MSVDVSPNNLVFNYFVTGSDSADFDSSRVEAGKKFLSVLTSVVQSGYTIGEILTALYRGVQIMGADTRRWCKQMLDFVQSYKPNFEALKNRFAPTGQVADSVVKYDDLSVTCVAYLEHLVNNAATDLAPGMTVNTLFDDKKLKELRSLYEGKSALLEKYKSGEKLSLQDRESLGQLFTKVQDVMEILSASFSDIGGNTDLSSTVILSADSLSSMATRLTNREARLIDDIQEQIRSQFRIRN